MTDISRIDGVDPAPVDSASAERAPLREMHGIVSLIRAAYAAPFHKPSAFICALLLGGSLTLFYWGALVPQVRASIVVPEVVLNMVEYLLLSIPAFIWIRSLGPGFERPVGNILRTLPGFVFAFTVGMLTIKAITTFGASLMGKAMAVLVVEPYLSGLPSSPEWFAGWVQNAGAVVLIVTLMAPLVTIAVAWPHASANSPISLRRIQRDLSEGWLSMATLWLVVVLPLTVAPLARAAFLQNRMAQGELTPQDGATLLAFELMASIGQWAGLLLFMAGLTAMARPRPPERAFSPHRKVS